MRSRTIVVIALLSSLVLLPALAAHAALQETLTPFDWSTASVDNVAGSWCVLAGGQVVGRFGDKKDLAERGVEVIKHYKFTAKGTIGNPEKPKMEYFVVDGAAPIGGMKGEWSKVLHHDKVEVAQKNDSWWIVEGKAGLIDFGKSPEAEGMANAALQVIQKYQFNHLCLVGHPYVPGKTMMYFYGGQTVRLPLVPVVLPQLKEDCIPFDPTKCDVQQVAGRWTVVAGNALLLNFKADEASARRALAVIQNYQMNSQCFVGRQAGEPGMMYYMVNGASPEGAMQGEDAIPFNNASLSVKENGANSWTVTDGASALMMFRTQSDAQQAITIIQRYGFTTQCFVGRPKRPDGGIMMYFRK